MIGGIGSQNEVKLSVKLMDFRIKNHQHKINKKNHFEFVKSEISSGNKFA